MNILLRKSKPADIQFMEAMLYEAVYWRANPSKPTFAEALTDPGFKKDLADWGARAGDTGVIALVDDIPAGAAWYRFYTEDNAIRGYINEAIPVIVIAVHPDYRRQGIGEKMMAWLLDQAAKHNLEKLSLMVAKDNHALKLYENCGFLEYADQGDALLMWRKTNRP